MRWVAVAEHCLDSHRLEFASKGERIMPRRGHIRHGVVAPDEPFPWPEGTEVIVEVVGPARRTTIAERFRDVIGSVTDLPSDMAENHDHYAHGKPKP